MKRPSLRSAFFALWLPFLGIPLLAVAALSGCAGFVNPDEPRRSMANIDSSYQVALAGLEVAVDADQLTVSQAGTALSLINRASIAFDAAEHAVMVEPTGNVTADLIAMAVAASGDLMRLAATFMSSDLFPAADIPAESLGMVMAKRHEVEARVRAKLQAVAGAA